MTSWITRLLAIGFFGVGAAAAETPVVVGAVVSVSGAQAAAAEGYARALLLWEEQVNAAGGLLGRRVEVRLRDDRSQAVRARAEYEKLVAENADALIGPYGSAATLLAAAVAERARRVMVNGAGPARSVHRRSPRYLFQSGAPYASYGAGVLELARTAGIERLYVLARDDPRARDMAEATAELARQQGFAQVHLASYAAGTADFKAQIAEARDRELGAWVAFGEVREAADMVRSFKRLDFAPQLFYASAAAEPAVIELLGQDAEFSLAALEYDARFATEGNAAFARAYAARWSGAPGLAAAQGYAAAQVLEAGVRKAGSLEQEKLRAALAALETGTVLGPYRVDPASGAQAGTRTPVAQILRGRPTPVWPRELEAANALLPYPQWGERSLLK